MFKRILSILAIVGVCNLSLSFQLKQRITGDKNAESIHHRAGQKFYYLWDLLDNAGQDTTPVSQTALVKYVPISVPGIPMPALFFLVLFIGLACTMRVFNTGICPGHLRITLLPEHGNYLFRLKPF